MPRLLMRILAAATLLIGASGAVMQAAADPPQTAMWETVQEAAYIARTLIAGTSVGTMATIFPADHPTLADQPYAMQEYYASCHANGSLTLILLPISRHSQNILHHPSHAASLAVWSDPPRASRARVSLLGNVTLLADAAAATEEQCYLRAHPDAKWWLPGDDEGAHVAYWARFDPQSVYFVGGFGDEHFIGDIPLDVYQAAVPDSGAIRDILRVQQD